MATDGHRLTGDRHGTAGHNQGFETSRRQGNAGQARAEHSRAAEQTGQAGYDLTGHCRTGQSYTERGRTGQDAAGQSGSQYDGTDSPPAALAPLGSS